MQRVRKKFHNNSLTFLPLVFLYKAVPFKFNKEEERLLSSKIKQCPKGESELLHQFDRSIFKSK